MGGCQGPSREVLKAAGLRQARWRPDQRLRLPVHTDSLWREDFHRPPAASVGSHLIDGHGRGISTSPPPPPTQQSSWRAALVPPIRDHYVDSPPPQDRGLDASFPPGLAHAQSAPPGCDQPAVPSIFLSMLSSTQETQVTTSFIFVPLQPLLHTAVILCKYDRGHVICARRGPGCEAALLSCPSGCVRGAAPGPAPCCVPPSPPALPVLPPPPPRRAEPGSALLATPFCLLPEGFSPAHRQQA